MNHKSPICPLHHFDSEKGRTLCAFFCVEGLVKRSHSFPWKTDMYNPPTPLQFTKALPNTLASFLFDLCGVDSVVYYQTSANNPLYSCNTGEETSKGKNRKTMSVRITNGICCAYWMAKKDTRSLNWHLLAEAGWSVSMQRQVEVEWSELDDCVSDQSFGSEQTDISQVGYWHSVISYERAFQCRCVIKVRDRDQVRETGIWPINSHWSDA